MTALKLILTETHLMQQCKMPDFFFFLICSPEANYPVPQYVFVSTRPPPPSAPMSHVDESLGNAQFTRTVFLKFLISN